MDVVSAVAIAGKRGDGDGRTETDPVGQDMRRRRESWECIL